MPGRRDVLKGLGAGVGLAGASFAGLLYRVDAVNQPVRYAAGGTGPDTGPVLEPTLQCEAGKLTREQTEGPFYTPKTPRRRDIRDAFHGGIDFVLAGRVLDAQCRPVPGAVLDFWQVDDKARYDNHGYRYRGHQLTDAEGRFELVTVRPQRYAAMGHLQDAPHPREGPGPGDADAHHPGLPARRAGEQLARHDLPRVPAHDAAGERRLGPARPLRLRPGQHVRRPVR